MAITRAQMPEQIDIFNEGGAAETDSYTTLYNDIVSQYQPDYDASYDKYFERLSQFAPEQPKMSIFEVASEIGRGLLATPNTGVGSAYKGLGVGFDNVSQRLQAKRAEFKKQQREIGMMAAQMALEDEQKANEFLSEIATKMIGDTNKDIKTMRIRYTDPNTNEVIETVMDKSSPQFRKIMKDPVSYNAQEITTPLMGGPDKYEALNKNTADAITDQETAWQEEANAQFGVIDKLNAARYYAKDLTEEDFGPVALFATGIKSSLTSLGFGDLIDQERLGDQIAVNSVGTGLAMGLISQTKGAISDREMAMFLKASATLGNNKDGFFKILDLTEKIANKTVQYNEQWLKERAKLQSEGKSLAEIRSAQSTFQKRFHAENPLFDYGEGAFYDDSLSVDENLKRIDPNSEAYGIVSAITPEGVAVYEDLAKRHSAISSNNLVIKNQLPAKNIPGVPEGSTPVFVTTDGKQVYLRPGGSIQNKEDLFVPEI